MKEFKKTLDFDGKFQVPATLKFDEKNWELSYHFDPTNQDVELGGTIENGKLVMTKDSSGYAKPLLATFQKFYDEVSKA